MPGLVLLDKLGQLGGDLVVGLARGGRGGLDDVGLGGLAGAVVGDGDDGAVVDEGVAEEVGF